MSEFLFGAIDVGGTRKRAEVWTLEGEVVGAVDGRVDPEDYDGSVDSIAGNIRQIAAGNGELVSVVSAVASELDKNGCMVLGGSLSTWDGKNLGRDVGVALGLRPEYAGSVNDMVAAAESQLERNARRGVYETGYVTTLSSGWGGKPYSRDGEIGYDSPGHSYLRPDAKCPCGGVGHNEAYVSGNGVSLNNKGVRIEDWLTDRNKARQFVTDLSTATVALIERNNKAGFELEVMRWMGGVATGQKALMRLAEDKVREQLLVRGARSVPVWEDVSLLDKAGIHGAFIVATSLAEAA
jgi:predicted NBD/HSP70 family sugar kinase